MSDFDGVRCHTISLRRFSAPKMLSRIVRRYGLAVGSQLEIKAARQFEHAVKLDEARRRHREIGHHR